MLPNVIKFIRAPGCGDLRQVVIEACIVAKERHFLASGLSDKLHAVAEVTITSNECERIKLLLVCKFHRLHDDRDIDLLLHLQSEAILA